MTSWIVQRVFLMKEDPSRKNNAFQRNFARPRNPKSLSPDSVHWWPAAAAPWLAFYWSSPRASERILLIHFRCSLLNRCQGARKMVGDEISALSQIPSGAEDNDKRLRVLNERRRKRFVCIFRSSIFLFFVAILVVLSSLFLYVSTLHTKNDSHNHTYSKCFLFLFLNL